MKQPFAIPALLAAFSSVMLLSACSDEVLDFRNAEIVNGKIYESGENEPFTGKVTNVPSIKVIGAHKGFETFMNVAKRVGLNTYTSETALCNVDIDKGVLNSKAVCTAPKSDIPILQLTFSQGVLDGKVEFNYVGNSEQVSVGNLETKSNDMGQLLVTGTFSKDQPDGKQEIFSPKTGRLVHVLHWKDGVPEGEEEGFYEDTGNLAMHALLDNGKYEGEFVQYAPDGKQVIYKGIFAAGKRNGPLDVYSPAGKHLAHAEWANDIQSLYQEWNEQGTLVLQKQYTGQGLERTEQQWDEQGNLLAQRQYNNLGSEISSTKPSSAAPESVQVDACVNSWTEAFHQENGNDAMVTVEQLDEWGGWCREGKHPQAHVGNLQVSSPG